MSLKNQDIRKFFSNSNGGDSLKTVDNFSDSNITKTNNVRRQKRKLNEICDISTDNRPTKKVRISPQISNDNVTTNNSVKQTISTTNDEEKMIENTNNTKNTNQSGSVEAKIIGEIEKYAINDINQYIQLNESSKLLQLKLKEMSEYNIIKIVFLTKPSRYYSIISLLQHHKESLYKMCIFHGYPHGYSVNIDIKDYIEYYTKSKGIKGVKQYEDEKIKTGYILDDRIIYDITSNEDKRFPIYYIDLKRTILSKMHYDALCGKANNSKEYIDEIIKYLQDPFQYDLSSNILSDESYKQIIIKCVAECFKDKEIKEIIKIRKKNEAYQAFEDYTIYMENIGRGRKMFYSIKLQKHIEKESYKIIIYWGENWVTGTTNCYFYNDKKKAIKKYKRKKTEKLGYWDEWMKQYIGGTYTIFDMNQYQKRRR